MKLQRRFMLGAMLMTGGLVLMLVTVALRPGDTGTVRAEAPPGPSTNAPGVGATSGTFVAPPAFSSGNLAASVFNGGTVAQLDSALAAVAAAGAWAQDASGEYRLYIVNGGFVNDGFRAAFPDGFANQIAITLVGSVAYKDASYEVAGQVVTLVNGVSEVEAAPGSAATITTRYFGNEASGDLNGDGASDVGFVLTQSTGGSGTFYYAVAALRTNSGFAGTNAVLLGDRVAPQTTEIRDGVLIVNYVDRNPGEPMTAQPSVGVSKYLHVVDGRLVEDELAGMSWTLTTVKGSAVIANTEITATFANGEVSGSAGCNYYSGGYTTGDHSITIAQNIAVTARACETSIMDQEAAYLAALTGAEQFSTVGDELTIRTGVGDLVFTRSRP